MKRSSSKAPATVVRCAIYTRKSTEDGLDQAFNTLDAQREAGEAYIASQKQAGWVCLPVHFDDGGFSGGNMDRPALQRLLAEVQAGKVDCIVVYKLDRLSRNIRDFSRMTEAFENRSVSFVSVTEQFNSATPMGRMHLNMLLTFAQYERELIAERTSDKIAATRRKGKWTGGMPLLGYDVVDKKLVVVEAEVEQVCQIFELYLEHRSLLATVEELNRRGWTTKVWTTKKGTRRGGDAFQKNRLHHLLTNVTYIGKLRYKDEVHEGEHPGIVDPDVFLSVQEMLSGNGHPGSSGARNRHGALLRGILRCAACNCGMTATYTSKGTRRYRYYVCNRAQQQGWKQCPAPSIPAAEIERFVVDQIRCIGRDPALVAATVAETRRQTDEAIQRLKCERAALERQRRVDSLDLGRRAGQDVDEGCIAQIQERIAAAERRLAEIRDEFDKSGGPAPTEDEVFAALSKFHGVWEALTPREQGRVLELLVERVEFDGLANQVKVAFHSTGIKALGDVLPRHEETAA